MINPTQFQERCLLVPEEYNLLLVGGKGGGKSMACILLVLRHIEQYGADAKPLLVRETHKALSELEEELASALIDVYGQGVKVNRSDHVIRAPNGAVVELGQIDGPLAYKKFSGRSKSLLVVDEVGLMRDKRWIELLRSNLRSSATKPDGSPMPLRTIWTGNPGGNLHALLHGMIVQAPAWSAYELNGEKWCNCISTYLDNPHLGGQDAYLGKLRASTADDALFKAFSLGDWNIAAGAFFALLSPEHHMIKSTWPYPGLRENWRPYISLDWGTGAPSVCYVVLKAPGGVGPFPRDSLILLDELASYDPNDLNKGLHWPPSKLAEAVVEMTDKWGVQPRGVGDDAYGLETTLQTELARLGVYVQRPKKHRVSGWARMHEMLHAAKTHNGKPGLWISERCQYFWKTVPFLERDPTRPEDIISTGPDHGADAARYAVMHALQVVKCGHHIGMY